MKKPWFYILLSMAGGPTYGSAVQEDVRTLSNGAVRLWPATLYGSLEDLVQKGWIQEVPEAEAPAGAGRERYYAITATGREALEEEVMRVESVAKVARERLGSVAPA